VSQPAGEDSVDLTIGRINDATGRLLATASALTDAKAREPSLLPGWSRGHVLTHIARNADGLRNLLIWAKTGTITPQYPSREVRDAEIEAGAGRPASAMAADLERSGTEFMAMAREVPDDAWAAEVQGSRWAPHPAWFTLHRRLFEVEVHHADLAAGYRAADWPGWFVTEQLDRVSAGLADDPAAPAAVLRDTGTGRQYSLRPDPAASIEIAGPGYLLLAWLLGRGDGAGLAANQTGPLPAVPPY
jgi:maleylpyruvate isomerase